MRRLLCCGLAVVAALTTAPPAGAAVRVRDCVSFVTYDFSPPIIRTPTVGLVTIGGPTTCIVTDVGGSTFVQTYTSGSTVTYAGNCLGAVMTNAPGGAYVGTLAGQHVTLTVNVVSSGAASANVATAVVPTLSCSGVAQIQTVMRWVSVNI